eukprot:CAMPEP_0194312110 /NCGR_PEP_ID=MMETSP0171-20130528/9027_1 /TAXON_ID=218684 /ORGANISM="Corethron pennatum, Strain L29A3" /LENGTH=377 /DNA_ID=CAMNT_0039066485 /DNA_START=244 /DNA_END=1377 /DNA_ORIENTATION=+
MSSYFENMFGFVEPPYMGIGRYFDVTQNPGDDDKTLTVKKGFFKNRTFALGSFETLSSQELQSSIKRCRKSSIASFRITFENIVGDISTYHERYASAHNSNSHAVIQAASQFNCLEMVGPSITPDQGITMYQNDQTQGPACAICCPAATVFRNYFVHVNGNAGLGQCGESSKQINTLALVSELITGNSNEDDYYYVLRNGYAIPHPGKMAELTTKLQANPDLCHAIVNNVQVGIHWNTEVKNSGKKICQVYASAVPVAYCNTSVTDWALFASLVLRGMYQATFAAAVRLQRIRQHEADAKADGGVGEQVRITLVLTMLGGGAFGNQMTWITDAIEHAVMMFHDEPLDVKLCHYSPIARESTFHIMAEKLTKAVECYD